MIGLMVDSNGREVPFKKLREFGLGVGPVKGTEFGDGYFVVVIDKGEPFASFLKEKNKEDFSISLLEGIVYIVDESSDFYYIYKLYDEERGNYDDFISQLARDKKVMFCIVDKNMEMEVSFAHDLIV